MSSPPKRYNLNDRKAPTNVKHATYRHTVTMKAFKSNSCCFLFFLLSRALHCELKLEALSLDTMQTRISLGSCIVETCKTYFAGSGAITYSMPLADVVDPKSFYLTSNFVLSSMQSEHQGTFLLIHLESPAYAFDPYQVKSESYIVQIRISGEFPLIMKGLRRSSSWNPHAKFLLVSSTAFEDPGEITGEVTRTLWEYNVVNSVILLLDPSDSSSFVAYSWEPYSDNSCGNNFFSSRAIDACSFGVRRNDVDWYGDKITEELYNCSITASYITWAPYVTDLATKPGIEVNLLNMIAEILHLYVVYQASNNTYWGDVFENDTASGDMQLLSEDKIDLVLGGYTQSYTRQVVFDCSRSYLQDTLVWCVPHEPILLGLQSLIDIISGGVWLGIVSIYIIITAGVWYLSRNSIEELRAYKVAGNAILNNFAVLIGFAASSLPKSNMMRYLVGLLISFSLYLNIVYSSYLTSMLSSKDFKEKYSSIESIYEYNLVTYFVPGTKGYFQGSDSNEGNYIGNIPVSKINERWEDCFNSTSCLERVLLEKDAAFCIPKLYKKYLFSNIEYLGKKKKMLYCLKDQVVTFPIIMIMRNGFPLYNIFQRIIDRINNVGFIDKWRKDLLMDKHDTKFEAFDDMVDETSIKLKNLRPIFATLVLIHLVSVLVFIAEITFHKKCQ